MAEALAKPCTVRRIAAGQRSGRLRCGKCLEMKPLEDFQPTNPYVCRKCLNAQALQNRRVKRGEAAWFLGAGLARPTLEARTAELLTAARGAVSVGCWRGRAGLRAYTKLRRAIAALERPGAPEHAEPAEIDPNAPPCTCPFYCARHADEVAEGAVWGSP